MATPTPSTNTPQRHLPAFSSPAPRSVPHTGATTGMMNYDSPAMLNMLNEGGTALGGVPMGGVNMDISLSQLGMPSASAMGRADEAERTRRLHNIIDTLKQKPGRVSEENVLALCARLGVPSEKVGEGAYLLPVGESNLLEIVFQDDQVEKIELQGGFDIHNADIRFGETGTKILTRNLKPLPGQSKMNVTLERFAENLEKLVILDKLGSPQNGGVSCYNAIAGVYTSLRKLFEHEKKIALTMLEEDTPHRLHKAEREVLCRKSGRPRPSGGDRLGLSLEYWMDRRHIIPKKRTRATSSEKGKEKMEVDSREEDEYLDDDEEQRTNKVFSLTLECESSPSTLYTPIRVSDDWISDAIEKPMDANDANTLNNILLNTPSIDWQEPKPTFLEPPASAADDDAMNLDAAPGRLPNIRFVAKFDPPLVVPITTYMSLYQSVGVEPPQDFLATTFIGLALRPGELDPGMTGTAGAITHEIRSSRTVLIRDEAGQEKDRIHNLSLYAPKMEYSRKLESLPFAHPKQLVEMLPILRQYAFTTSLLQASFLEMTEQKNTSQLPTTPITPDTNSLEGDGPLQVDVNLSYTPPAPRLTLHIPRPPSKVASSPMTAPLPGAATPSSVSDLLAGLLSDTASSPAVSHTPLSVTLDVHGNAELIVSEQNVTEGRTGGEEDLDKVQEVEAKIKRVGRALEVSGDLSIWGEWLRREVAGSSSS
ncbi:uncharacterized protein EKO05_0005688 [Ascochyta rabiei]|uniref:Mediator of RNA polymerase II transcription subunit 1 n=1 Tax=Didymella rabiei TaxID=5454 RepID=A0A163EIM2_DIDRA|nr:uncharacterized protein EKO05_0005688 [Ascochyta rabiei]KZM23715.1 RNA polymerase II transcription cofactor [Ascochyta rabiei]UPX15231.1 hypothetical protein EKO05_0005688 [Ascochyta rabiei]